MTKKQFTLIAFGILSSCMLTTSLAATNPQNQQATNPYLQQYQTMLNQAQQSAYQQNQQQLQTSGSTDTNKGPTPTTVSSPAQNAQQQIGPAQQNPWLRPNPWAAAAKNNPWAKPRPKQTAPIPSNTSTTSNNPNITNATAAVTPATNRGTAAGTTSQMANPPQTTPNIYLPPSTNNPAGQSNPNPYQPGR